MTPEGKVKRKVFEWLKENFPGHWRCMPLGSAFGKAGVPDILICWQGIFIALEIKAEGGALTALQIMNLKLIQKAGGVAAMIRGFDTNKLQLVKAICLSRLKNMNGQPTEV